MICLFVLKVESLRDEADKAKRECLGVKKIAEEKEILFKQEQAALRKVCNLVLKSTVHKETVSSYFKNIDFTFILVNNV